MRLPDFEAWAIFAAVAEAGSVTGAGRQLRLSKATVSKALARLENQIGAPLFHRTTRKLELNENGRALLPRAQKILADAMALEESAREEASEPIGIIRVAAPMTYGQIKVTGLVARFIAAHPGISIDLRLNDSVVDIIADRFDIAIRAGTLPDSSLLARRIQSIRLRLVGSPEYFATYGYPRHPAELSEHRTVGYSLKSNAEVWSFIGPDNASASVATSSRLRINNGEAILPALRLGEGIGLLPDFITTNDRANGTLVSVLDEWSYAPPMALYLVTPPSAVRSKRVSLLLDYLATELVDLSISD